MKKIISTTILLLYGTVIIAQNTDESLLSQKLSYSYIDHRKFLHIEHTGLFFASYYTVMGFPEAPYINTSWLGSRHTFGITYFPFILEGGIQKGKFTIDNAIIIPVYEQNNSIDYQGYNLSLVYCPPIPRINQYFKYLSETIIPYVGAGYHFSFIKYEETSSDTFSQLNLYTWVVKAGCKISLKKLPFSIIADFEHSINHKDVRRNFYCINVGVSVNLYHRYFVPDYYSKEKPKLIYLQ